MKISAQVRNSGGSHEVREADRMGIAITSVDVEATAEFPGVGLAAQNIQYRATVLSPASPAHVEALIRHTDAVAEVHNTVRAGVPVELVLGGQGQPGSA